LATAGFISALDTSVDPQTGQDTSPPAAWRSKSSPERNQRMAVGLAPVLVAAALCGGDDEGAVLDGAGAQQHMPVGLAGLAGEGGRRGQDLGSGQRLLAKQMREAHVVADGEAEPRGPVGKGEIGQHRGAPGAVGA
jgi:hypothetical protein